MNVSDVCQKIFSNDFENTHDFVLVKYSDDFYMGKDIDGNATVVGVSNKPNRLPVLQKTKKLSMECNVIVNYVLDGCSQRGTVHIIRCFAENRKEMEIFYELSLLFFDALHKRDQEEALLETFGVLDSFFENVLEPSEIELEGMYAELYTLIDFSDKLHLERYWQSKERLKFDFSITDRVKIEVKSTMKNERRHHFRHEQLDTYLFDTVVISYQFRHDDQGLSLYDVIQKAKLILANDTKRILIIDKIVKNTSEERLRDFKYNETLFLSKRLICKADSIPKFEETTPTGVSNAEYDCNLDGVNQMTEEEFINLILSVEK